MTRDEFIAQRFASQKRIATQSDLIDKIEAEHEATLKLALEGPKEQLTILCDADDREHKACLAQLDFIPFKRHDFITNGSGTYYEVDAVDVNVSSIEATELEPDADFLRILIRAHEIRKSGTLAKHYTTCRMDRGHYRKAEMSEDIRLRRAIKQRMRRRLEGGD